MNDLTPSQKLAQWFYSVSYEELSEDQKALMDDIAEDVLEGTKNVPYILLAASILSNILLVLLVLMP